MFVNIIGAEIKKAGRQYSPRGVAVIGDGDFITSDIEAISMYNTDVFCDIGTAQVPVYSNLADIPASRLPNRMSVKVTDEAYPLKARWVNTNFRVEYMGISSPSECSTCSISEPVGVLPFVMPWLLLIKVAAILVVVVAIGAVICMIFNAIHALMLPGGVSGAERDITDNRKLVTYPDGSWDIYDTETSEIIKGGIKPEMLLSGIIVPIVLGVAGIAGIYIFIKWGMPAIARKMPLLKPKPETEAG